MLAPLVMRLHQSLIQYAIGRLATCAAHRSGAGARPAALAGGDVDGEAALCRVIIGRIEENPLEPGEISRRVERVGFDDAHAMVEPVEAHILPRQARIERVLFNPDQPMPPRRSRLAPFRNCNKRSADTASEFDLRPMPFAGRRQRGGQQHRVHIHPIAPGRLTYADTPAEQGVFGEFGLWHATLCAIGGA